MSGAIEDRTPHRGVTVWLRTEEIAAEPPPSANGHEKPPTLAKRAAIVAFSARHRDLAPWDDDRYAFWTLNDGYRLFQGRPFTRWYEMHSRAELATAVRDKLYLPDHLEVLERMAKAGLPIYTIGGAWTTEIPGASAYPIERVTERLSSRYFTSTVALMIAHALVEILDGEREPHIALFGVELGITSEYARERACVEHWLGVAKGKGITVELPPGSTLLSSPYLYGYDDMTRWERDSVIASRNRELTLTLMERRQARDALTVEVERIEGMLQENAWASAQLSDKTVPGVAL